MQLLGFGHYYSSSITNQGSTQCLQASLLHDIIRRNMYTREAWLCCNAVWPTFLVWDLMTHPLATLGVENLKIREN